MPAFLTRLLKPAPRPPLPSAFPPRVLPMTAIDARFWTLRRQRRQTRKDA